MKKLFLILCPVLLIFSSMFVACNSDNQDKSNIEIPNAEKNVVIEDNNLKNNEGQSYYFCGYRAYNTDFNLDSVKLSFYYGSLVDVNKNLNSSNLNFAIELCDVTSSYSSDSDAIYDISTYETVRIKEISFKEFCLDNSDLVKPYDGIYQYHEEEITIPGHIFKYNSGIISFCLVEEYLSSNGEEKAGMGCSIALFYKNENSRITVSNKAF